VVAACALLLGACGTSAGDTTSSSAPEPTLDCVRVQVAMDDYATALADLAASLQAGDAMSAIGAADAMSFSLDQLEGSLPGIPAAGQNFLDASRAVALRVKQSAAESPQLTGLLGDLTAAFADPAFAEGGEAMDEYAKRACPNASSAP